MVVGKIGLFAIAHKEQIAQHPDAFPLLAVPEEGSYRKIQIFAKQIQKRCLNRSQHVHARTQIKGLCTALVLLSLGIQIFLYAQEGIFVIGCPRPFHDRHNLFQCGCDFRPSGHFANAGSPVGISHYNDIPGKIGSVGA